ncbi:hypothetical protein OCOL_000393 [Ordospora colligata]|uniref:PDEase domain-containing protein n=1 Tax=Ordospora colligata OC4 TaxID=1354746 RepID=A0A0B2UJ76_9MICR|nr:uncharacterized protein M896_100240 [Ordospora colligata OC4]KHN69040.1 hypothetical protein M896_100240 [Ordospora colligata OC4]TBU14321.1 hypothetical protein CWI40_100250 [Ordospora colligata]TBU14386.1 hypothetical protein CWI41_100250 [Ordospora colligata]
MYVIDEEVGSVCDVAAEIVLNRADVVKHQMSKSNTIDEFSHYLFHADKVTLSTGIMLGRKMIMSDRRVSIEEKVLDEFFGSALLYSLPQMYHNIDHLVNTLCFGGFMLREIEKRDETCIWQRTCFMISLCLHDIGHPGEPSRNGIGMLCNAYGCGEETMSFEEIHATISNRVVNEYKKELFGEMKGADTDECVKLVRRLIFATDLRMNKEVIDEFDLKYIVNGEEGRIRNGKRREVGEIELKMIMKLADLSACYKDYVIFDKNSELFWSEVWDVERYSRGVNEIHEDINLLEKISIPLIDSFSMVFEEFRMLCYRARQNLEKHKKYYDGLKVSMEMF